MQMIEKSYYELLCEQAEAHPDREAIVMGEERLTYLQLLKRIERIAGALARMGVRKGDKVVLWSVASPTWLCAYYGIIRAGGIAVVLNANLTVKDAAPLVAFADTAFVLFGQTHDTRGLADETAGLAERFGLEKGHVLCLSGESFAWESGPLPDASGWDVHDDAYIIYTSGTTAFPKAVLTSQYGIVNAAAHLADAIKAAKGERAVMAVPLFHAYGLMVSWIYLSTGGTVLIPEKIKADVVASLVEDEEATDLWSVAVIYQGIVDSKALAARTAERLRLCTIAGSYTTPVQFMRYEATLYKSVFINMYGMTETCAAYCLTRPEDEMRVRYNTVGRPIEGVEAAAWDAERGILPPGEVG